jgi:hypothetical protein
MTSLGGVDPPSQRSSRDYTINGGQWKPGLMGFPSGVCCSLETISTTKLLLITIIVFLVASTTMTVIWTTMIPSRTGESSLMENTMAFKMAGPVRNSLAGEGSAQRAKTDDEPPETPRVLQKKTKTTFRETITTTTGQASAFGRQDDDEADNGGRGRYRENNDDESASDRRDRDSLLSCELSTNDRVPECHWMEELNGYFCCIPMAREVNKESSFPSAGILKGSSNGASVFLTGLQCKDTSGKIHVFPRAVELNVELAFDSKLNGYYLEVSTTLEALTSSWCKLLYIIVK